MVGEVGSYALVLSRPQLARIGEVESDADDGVDSPATRRKTRTATGGRPWWAKLFLAFAASISARGDDRRSSIFPSLQERGGSRGVLAPQKQNNCWRGSVRGGRAILVVGGVMRRFASWTPRGQGELQRSSVER